MTNSRQKGARGEREWRNVLRAHGTEARRGQQYCGSPDSPDVISDDGIHWEVKRVERLNIDKAMDQAIADCGEKTPAVAHRKNGKPWMITMLFDDWFKVMKGGE